MWERAGSWAQRHPDTCAIALIAGAVILANLPSLLGLYDANPLGVRSGLISAFTPGHTGQPTLDPNNGFVSQALGHLAASDLLHFHLPWWDPYEGTGVPLLGEMQSAALFPPTLLLALSNGLLYEHVLLELVAGISTYALLRRLGLGRFAATAAGIAFGLNGTFSWFDHAPVNPIAFLPLMLLGVEQAYGATVERRHGGWWLVAVAGALSLYAGFYETTYIDSLLVVCWLVWRCACLGRLAFGRLLVKAALGAGFGLMLAAPVLLASLEYVAHGQLGLNGTGAVGGFHLVSAAWPQLFMPYLYGPLYGYTDPHLISLAVWENVGGYLTALLIALALFGLAAPGRRGLKLTLVAWLLLAVARSYGEPPLIGGILGLLPRMHEVAFYRYAPASIEFPVVVLAALGVDDLRGRVWGRRRRLVAAAGMVVLVGLAALEGHRLTRALGSAYAHRHYFAIALVWGLGSVLALLVVAGLSSARRRAALVTVLVAIEAVGMFAVPQFSNPRAVSVDLAPVSFLKANLGSGRFFTLGPLQPNYGSYFRVSSLNFNDVPVPKAFARYVHARLDQFVDPTVLVGNYGGARNPFLPSPTAELQRNLDGYRAAGVRYVLAPRGTTLPYPLVLRTSSTWIYELSGAQPLYTAAGCTTLRQALDSVTLSCSRGSTLVRRETSFPGWSAAVDGRSAGIRTVDGLFQGVAAPAGRHTIEFSFSPPGATWSLLAALLAVAAILGAPLRRRVGRPFRGRSQAGAEEGVR